MHSEGLIDRQGRNWLLRVISFAERTILNREIGLCPGDD